MCLGGLLALACDSRDRRDLQSSDLRSELFAAVSSVRPVEGRITRSPFAPYRASEPAVSPSRADIQQIAGRMQARAGRRESAQALADLAILWLLAGNRDQALVLLEKAAHQEPRNAGVLNDLAVAYLARAREGARPEDFVRALTAADRAAREDAGLVEARFNRALALEKLFLKTAALRAWRDLSLRESDPGWSREAAEHLRRLEARSESEVWDDQRPRLDAAALRGDTREVEALVDQFRQPARLYAEEELLSAWAEEISRGRMAGAERPLQIARAIGAALVRRGADAMVHDAVEAIDQSQAEPERFASLYEGHRIYGTGLRHYKQRQLDLAIFELSSAERLLGQAGTPFVHWGRLYLAASQYHQARIEPARRALEDLRDDLDGALYPSLLGRFVWLLGSIEILRGRPGDALPLFRQGQQLFARTGEIEDLAAMHQHLAIALGFLGESDETWQYLYRALRALAQVHSSQRFFAILDEAGIVCLRHGQSEVALHFQNELLAFASRIENPEAIATALLRRAPTLHSLGRTREALHELNEALQLIAGLGRSADRLRAAILAARGETRLSSETATAIRDLTEAIRFFEASNLRFDVSSTYVLRARAHLAAGDAGRAEEDFQAGLRELERVRGSVIEGRLRISLYDRATSFIDEILAFEVDQGDLAGARDTAFEISERARGRELLESLALSSLGQTPRKSDDRLLTIKEIQKILPARTLLVKYVVLEDRSLLWALSQERVEFQQIPVGATWLASQVAEIRGSLRNTSSFPASSRALREVYEQLVQPIEADRHDTRRMIFIPDKSLHLLPFAALINPATGRYLIEDRAVGIAPSANVYARCVMRYRDVAANALTSVLAVSGESFDQKRFPGLSPLPDSRAEAEAIAAGYPRAHLLTGGGATRERVFKEAAKVPDIVHFATHSIPSSDFPELSLLLLAKGPGKSDSGAVYSHEIYGLQLVGTRLVFLSACSTAAGRLSASEGAMSLARPFLAAGVPAVLATLWRVEDSLAQNISVQFHRRLRAGEDPVEALRSAQLEMLASTGKAAHPAHWASFQLIGGSSP